MVGVEIGRKNKETPPRFIVEVALVVSEYLERSIRNHLPELVGQEKNTDLFTDLAGRISRGKAFRNKHNRVMVRVSLSEQDLAGIGRLRSDRVIPASITEAGEIAAATMSLGRAFRIAKNNDRIERKGFWRRGK